MTVNKSWLSWFILVSLVLLSACSGRREMMPTPSVYVQEGTGLYEGLPSDLKSTQVPVFYVTDRLPEQTENGKLAYGFERSPSLGFGRAVVGMGDEISWADLIEASRTLSRPKPVHLELTDVTEITRGPNSPIPFDVVDGQVIEKPEQVAKREVASATFRSSIVKQLEQTSRKDVFIFVHGFHNSFED